MLASGCSPSNGFDSTDQFALVSYIPDPLGRFLDDLRVRLDPDCKPHAHVTILPPRPLCGPSEQAIRNLRRLSKQFEPYWIDLVEVAKFDVSDVVYLKIGKGRPQLRAMYESMNCGPCEYSERFRYSPHITLAQNIAHEKVQATWEMAIKAWAEWSGERKFRVEELSFVHNTGEKWVDLEHITLLERPKLPLATQTDRAEPQCQV
jgi:2'-5' RNA ligase